MRLSRQLQASLLLFFFLWKDFSRTIVFVVLSLLVFVLLVGFSLSRVSVRAKSFHKNKKNWLEVALRTSNTILLTCTPIDRPIKNLFVCTYFYFSESLIICDNLFFLWESFWIFSFLWLSLWIYVFMKQASVWIPSIKTNILSSKHYNDILLILYVPSLRFLL